MPCGTGAVDDSFRNLFRNLLQEDSFDCVYMLDGPLLHLDDLFQDLRRWHIDSLFGSTFRDALLVNDFSDFHNSFANLRHWYIVSMFDNTLRDAPLRNDFRDFQNLFLDLRHRH